ncbi:MAG: hypothetical protein NTU62_08200 [Spirochaetes bacterium]|nr:hypothetical protein [Spirochaetota bacterium]
MKLLGVCALALCCWACPAAVPAAAEVVTRLEWPGILSVRCSIPLGATQLQLLCDTEPAGPIRLAAGLDGPVVRAGPLAAAGLLREAAGPLGFSPGTGVSGEATGLRFDGSFAGPEGFSVQLTVIPEAFALFWLHPEGEPGVLGCTIGTGRRGPVALEAMASVCDPGADAPGEEWISDCAPSPSGRVLHGASRIGVSLPGLSATVSGGLSAAERAPPGWYVLGAAAIGRGDSGIDLLAAGASSSYLLLGGKSGSGGLRAGVRLRLSGPLARIRARYVMSVGLPGFVPGPFLAAEEELAFTLERRWPARGGTWKAALSASNRLETGQGGTTVDDPSGSLSAGWDSARLQAGATADFDRDEGAGVEVSVSAAGVGGRGGAGGEVRCAWSGRDPATLSLSGHARFARDAWEVLLRAGVRDVRLISGGIGDCGPWGSVEWRVTERAGSVPAGRAR